MHKPGKIITAVAAALALGACSPPGEQDSTEPTGSDLTPIEGAEDEEAPSDEDESAEGAECTAEDFTIDGEPGEPPEVTVPDDCAAPSELLVDDLSAGSGEEVATGDTVEVHYQLVTFSDGEVVDSSWQRNETFPVESVGDAPVVDGWNEGLLGITEGARRLLVVPPELGYGEEGSPPDVEPGETLVFVIDAVSVSGPNQ